MLRRKLEEQQYVYHEIYWEGVSKYLTLLIEVYFFESDGKNQSTSRRYSNVNDFAEFLPTSMIKSQVSGKSRFTRRADI